MFQHGIPAALAGQGGHYLLGTPVGRMGPVLDQLLLLQAVNASGFQLDAAFAGWLGGVLIALGVRSLLLAGGLLTLAGLAVALYVGRRDRVPA